MTDLNLAEVKLVEHNSEASLESNDHVSELQEVTVKNQVEHLDKSSKGKEKYPQETVQIFPTPRQKQNEVIIHIVLFPRTWLECKSTGTFYC